MALVEADGAAPDDEEEEGPIAVAVQMLDDLFSNHPTSLCKSASQEYRVARGLALSSPSLVYGEVPLEAFLELLAHVKQRHGFQRDGQPLATGGRFADLGCGAGKAVFAAAITPCHDFAACTGVEIVPPLYGMCLELLAEWQEDFAPALPAPKQDTELRFMLGDMLLTDWGEAEVVFANSSCFDTDTMAKLSDYAQDLNKGAICMTASHPLQDVEEAYELLEVYEMRAAFGALSIYVQRKLSTF